MLFIQGYNYAEIKQDKFHGLFDSVAKFGQAKQVQSDDVKAEQLIDSAHVAFYDKKYKGFNAA